MLAVAWNSAAASEREARVQSGSIVVAGAGLPTATGIYRRYPNGRLQQLTTAGEHAPAWSRDGRRIALIRPEIANGPDVCPLWVMNSDGSDLHQVGQVRTDCSGVSWGPGDRRIVFGGGRPGRINDGLWVVNVDGSGLKRLLGGRGATEGIHPTWSPDGRTIIFGWTGRSRHPWGRLAAIRPDGSGFHIVVGPRSAPHEDEVSLPTWSRDGKRLAYIRVDHRSGHVQRTLEVADARGHHRRMLVRLPIGPFRRPCLVAEWTLDRLLEYVPRSMRLDHSQPRRNAARAHARVHRAGVGPLRHLALGGHLRTLAQALGPMTSVG